MKQRAMIASALILSPTLLLMDEPTSALDVSVQAQITNLLKALKRDLRTSMLFITHDIALASDLCDSLAVVYGGQIVERGSAEAVLRTPAHPYTQRLLASIPSLHDPTPPAFLPGAPPDLREALDGCRFAARCPVVYEACTQAPPLHDLDDEHHARCWRAAADVPSAVEGAAS